MMAVKLLYFVR